MSNIRHDRTFDINREEGYVDITTRVLMWGWVPDERRITEEMVKDSYAYKSWNSSGQKLIARLSNPKCLGTVAAGKNDVPRDVDHKPLLKPCGVDPAVGEDLCPNHGGPLKLAGPHGNVHTIAALQRENDDLRDKLAQLEAAVMQPKAAFK